MPGRKKRLLLFLAIALILQGALSSAWAASRCVARGNCEPQASAPCPMHPCEEMSGDCNEAAASKIVCEEGCARVFSKVPAVPALAPHAPPACAVAVAIVPATDISHAFPAAGARREPSSRGRPPLYLSTHSLLI